MSRPSGQSRISAQGPDARIVGKTAQTDWREAHGQARGHPRLHARDDDGVLRQGSRRSDARARRPRHRTLVVRWTAKSYLDRRDEDRSCRPSRRTPAPSKIMDVMSPGDEVPEMCCRTRRGIHGKLSDWRGRALAVTFVYTRCPVPDFCPLMDRQFARPAARDRGGSGAAGSRHTWCRSASIPRTTRPSVIAAHAKARGAEPRTWSYLTGTARRASTISRPGSACRRSWTRIRRETITHNLRTAVIDSHGTTGQDLLGQRMDRGRRSSPICAMPRA